MIRHRYISNYIVYRSQLYINNVMSIDGDEVTLVKVSDELAHTEYVAGIIAVVDSERAADAVSKFVRSSSGDKLEIIDYLKNSDEVNLPGHDHIIMLQIIPESRLVKRIRRVE